MNRGYLIFLFYNTLIGKISQANIFYMRLLLQTVFFVSSSSCDFTRIQFISVFTASANNLIENFPTRTPVKKRMVRPSDLLDLLFDMLRRDTKHIPDLKWRTLYLISILKTQRSIKKTTRSTRNKDTKMTAARKPTQSLETVWMNLIHLIRFSPSLSKYIGVVFNCRIKTG